METGENNGISGFIIRDYAAGDFLKVQELWKATGMAGTDRKDDNEVIMRTIGMGGCLLVMTDPATSEICGTSWLTCDGRRTFLHHFGILPTHQGKGLAGLLIDETMKRAREMGCQVKLEVHRSNKKALQLYLKSGFRYLGDYDVYIIRDI